MQLLDDNIRNVSNCFEMRCSHGRYREEDICIHELGGKTWRKVSFLDLVVEESVIFKWLLQKNDGSMWTALVSLRIRTSSGGL